MSIIEIKEVDICGECESKLIKEYGYYGDYYYFQSNCKCGYKEKKWHKSEVSENIKNKFKNAG